MKNQSRQENLIYLVVWSLLFATPLLSLYLRTMSDDNLSFQWGEVFFIWGKFIIFLLLFLFHNFLLAPLLIHQHKRALYISAIAIVITGFVFVQMKTHPRPFPDRERREFFRGPRPDHEPPHMPPEFKGGKPAPPFMRKNGLGDSLHDIIATVVLLLMFGANLGAKLYFRTRNDQRKLQELEKQNLEQQLEYLKYQINPHFFMNTLNNIHALVDIDPAKAQDTILELSKMMRFVLYEGDKSGVPLNRELEFIRTYITLMQLRYTDKVKINLDLPTQVPDKTIPPLMLVSFIENAFKHGVSYQHDSFIDIKVELIEPLPQVTHLHFTCTNSKAEKPNQEKGGVGLVNVKKRLDLLYDKNYTLSIKDDTDTYFVELILPL
ncbi:MAG: sensor histidine kinase [Prevotella sp.]|nr:sensor histidine kinase [Prevotella sp.]MBR0188552.1 sensor histidine kinase [Prevotella sp.]